MDRYAVIGNPISHSLSPMIHAQFARQTGQPLSYGAVLGKIGQFAQSVDQFSRDGGCGMNVTVPFKLDAFAYAQQHSVRALAAGAVNTLVLNGEGVYGDNTDGAGLLNDLAGRLAHPVAGNKVLILGAGGASRGVLLPLLNAGVATIHICNRSAAKAHELAALDRDGRVLAVGSDALAQSAMHFDIVINATSTGLSDLPLPIPAAILRSAGLAYEMLYAAKPTRFMTQAAQAGCARVCDGLGMLLEQAAESFYVWRGVRPQTEPVYAALREHLDRGE